MNVTIKVGDTPRVYVERIDITGNTITPTRSSAASSGSTKATRSTRSS